MNYIIVRQDGGYYTPITWKDGTLVVYSNKNEAIEDLYGEDEFIAEINITDIHG